MKLKTRLIVAFSISLIVLIGSLILGASSGVAAIIALVLGILFIVFTDYRFYQWDRERVRKISETRRKESQIRNYERGIKRRSYLEERGKQEARSGFVGREEKRGYDNPFKLNFK